MPGEPEELWLPDSQLPLKVQNLIDFGENSSEDIGDIAEGAWKACDLQSLLP